MTEVKKDNRIIMSEQTTKSLLNRRQWLFGAGMALAGLGAAAKIEGQTTFLPTPRLTEGPFFVDEKLNRSDIRTDVSNGTAVPGLPLYLAVAVSRIDNGVITPLSGAYVDIWQANASGVYSDVPASGTVGRTFLRGYQITGSHGTVRFLTIFPGWYAGRAVHIHAKVRLYSGNSITYSYNTQLFFSDSVTNSIYTLTNYNNRGTRDTLNSADSVYNCSVSNGNAGDIMQLRMASDSSYAVASTHLILNVSGTNPGCN